MIVSFHNSNNNKFLTEAKKKSGTKNKMLKKKKIESRIFSLADLR